MVKTVGGFIYERKHMEIVQKSIDFSEVLEYNTGSPSCLTWKITVSDRVKVREILVEL